MEFGFAMMDNEHETVSVPIEVDRDHALWAHQRRLLGEYGIYAGWPAKLSLDEVCLDLVVAHRILVMDKETILSVIDTDTTQRTHKSPEGGSVTASSDSGEEECDNDVTGIRAPVSLANEEAALMRAMKGLEEWLSALPTSLDHDVTSLDRDEAALSAHCSQSPLPPPCPMTSSKDDSAVMMNEERWVNAIVYRITRKRIVTSQVRLIRDLMSEVGRLSNRTGEQGDRGGRAEQEEKSREGVDDDDDPRMGEDAIARLKRCEIQDD